MQLNDIFKNSNYDNTQFTDTEKQALESRIIIKTVKGADVPYITCLIRKKEIRLTPEEAVRQLFLDKLINKYGYPSDRLSIETPIYFGREVKRADIFVSDQDRPTVPRVNRQPYFELDESKKQRCGSGCCSRFKHRAN